MAENHIPRRVENYTNAFLCSAGLLLFMALWMVGVFWGFGTIMIIAVVMDLIIKYIGTRKRD